MTYRAVDRHNMMGGRGFRVEQLKFRTFVFQFLALVCIVFVTMPRREEVKCLSQLWR